MRKNLWPLRMQKDAIHSDKSVYLWDYAPPPRLLLLPLKDK